MSDWPACWLARTSPAWTAWPEPLPGPPPSCCWGRGARARRICTVSGWSCGRSRRARALVREGGGRGGGAGGERQTGAGPAGLSAHPYPPTPQPAARGQMRHLVPGELPDEAAALMRRCLEADPRARPTSREAYDVLAACSPPVQVPGSPRRGGGARGASVAASASTTGDGAVGDVDAGRSGTRPGSGPTPSGPTPCEGVTPRDTPCNPSPTPPPDPAGLPAHPGTPTVDAPRASPFAAAAGHPARWEAPGHLVRALRRGAAALAPPRRSTPGAVVPGGSDSDSSFDGVACL